LKGKIMRIPAEGGPPQPLLEVTGYPGSAQLPRELGTRVLTASCYPDFRCPHRSGSACGLVESDVGSKVVFYSFDPIRGNKSELVRVNAEGPSFWDLSPDGSQIAFGEVARKDRVRILSAGTGREILVKGFRAIASVAWSSDGASLFLTGTAPEGGSVLRRVSANGQGPILYQADTWLEKLVPSPDGRYLVFGQATSSNNVWTIENFGPR